MPPQPPRDPGLQPERTSLAWGRTALAMGANGLLLLRSGIVGQQPLLIVLSVALLLSTAWALRYTGRHRRALALQGSAPALHAWAPLLLTLWMFVAAAGAVYSMLNAAR